MGDNINSSGSRRGPDRARRVAIVAEPAQRPCTPREPSSSLPFSRFSGAPDTGSIVKSNVDTSRGTPRPRRLLFLPLLSSVSPFLPKRPLKAPLDPPIFFFVFIYISCVVMLLLWGTRDAGRRKVGVMSEALTGRQEAATVRACANDSRAFARSGPPRRGQPAPIISGTYIAVSQLSVD